MEFNRNFNDSDIIDIDITISHSSLTYLQKKLYEYKERILRDLSKELNIPFKDLKEEFLVTEKKTNKYHGPDRSEIDNSKCMARIWHTKLGGVQCSKNKKNDSDYCAIHTKKRNYGRIDEVIESRFT